MNMYFTYTLGRIRSLTLVALLIFTTASIHSQESILALGRVAPDGTLADSANSLDGVVTASRTGEGAYTITITAPGAFAGSSGFDYTIETTVYGTASDDDAIRSAASVVSDDQFTIAVRTDDVEDVANSTGHVQFPNDSSFYFAVYRVPDGSFVPAESEYLMATGRVNGSGDLLSFAAIENIEINTQRDSDGEYSVDLIKPGGFGLDTFHDYVLIGTPVGPNTGDIGIRAGIISAASINNVQFSFRTDDLQQSDDHDLPTPGNSAFCFSIYRLAGIPNSGPSPSSLLVSLANISTLGSVNSSACSIPGATVSATRNSNGNYTVTINAPGAFAGKVDVDYLAHANIAQSVSGDEVANLRTEVINANTLEIDVFVNDVENPGSNFGTPTNSGFHLTLFEASSDYQPDLRIGKRRSVSSMKGNNRYNNSGGGQQARLKLSKLRKKKFHFALENDGNLTNSFRLRESGAGKRVKVKFYKLSGGRKNVTGKVTRSGLVEKGVAPGKMIKYQGQIKYRKMDRRPSRKVKVRASSVFSPGDRDTNRIKIKAK